ncbi:MAG: hypothetical protein WCL51_16940 [Bacteroidota bacterium]
MKKLVTILFLLTLWVTTFSQKKYDSYESSYFNKEYDLSLSYKSELDFTLWITAPSFDKLHSKDGVLSLSFQRFDNFTNALIEAKSKYIEWVKTAKENNVNDLLKHMELSNKSKIDVGFVYGEMQFNFDITLKYDFMILQKGDKIKYLLLIKTGEVVSSSNQFMKSDGLAIVLSSEKEINDFLDKISLDKIRKITSKPKSEELFK